MTTLARPDRPGDDDPERLRARAADIEATLTARSHELARAQAELRVFEIGYRQQVGLLHEELDDLEAAIAEAELGEMAKDEDTTQSASKGAETGRPEAQARYTSDAVRRLFRDVAKIIHPDLARDDHSRDRRHSLMVEANRAYELGDEERLRSILHAWHRSPEAVPGTDPEATWQRLLRRVAQLEEELESVGNELSALKLSPLWQLKAMVDEAAERGRDLVGDMVARLKRDIMVARNRLDAMKS